MYNRALTDLPSYNFHNYVKICMIKAHPLVTKSYKISTKNFDDERLANNKKNQRKPSIRPRVPAITLIQ